MQYIQITKLNDFLFCPYSVYLHSVYEGFEESTYKGIPQIKGSIKHENVDDSTYSSLKRYIQGLSIYSSEYKLVGKLDVYDSENKTIIERKYKIKQIFLGYKYQLYAQYVCLKEMGFEVFSLKIHSLSDNKRYDINLPNSQALLDFKSFINKINSFDPDEFSRKSFNINDNRCLNCIYSNLCVYY